MSFTRSTEIEALARALVQVFPENFEHLEEARIGYLFTDEEIVTKGSRKAGYAIIPSAMGQNRKLFDWCMEQTFGFLPDALIVIDAEIWEEFTEEQRIALGFHELSHLRHAHTKAGEPRYTEEGTPVIEVADHDVEEFLGVAHIFGAWHDGLKLFSKVLQGKGDPGKIAEVKKLWKP